MTTPSLPQPDRLLMDVVATPIPPSLLAAPLDYLLAEHMRLRAVCSLLRNAAEVGHLNAECASVVTLFIKSALPVHREDEERDLFPALLKSARSADELGGTIENLKADHRRMEKIQAEVVEALACHHPNSPLIIPRMVAQLLRDFADAERRHVAIENGIVLAIARARIGAKGLGGIAESMSARRRLSA
ncbi:MAG: hemerythrin domain-containing protein [Beijerinckiaceae bacterium]